jgi:hypothetical protein
VHPDIQRALDAITAAVAGMTAEEMGERPAGKWSTALILEHLLLSYRTSGARLVSVVDTGAAQVRSGTVKERFGAFVVTGLGLFPTGRTAPGYVEPKGMPIPGVVDAAKAALTDFDAAATRCEARFGPGAKVANHPILGPFSVRQWRRFHLVHTRHHLKQVARLRAARSGAAA